MVYVINKTVYSLEYYYLTISLANVVTLCYALCRFVLLSFKLTMKIQTPCPYLSKRMVIKFMVCEIND